MDCSSIIKAILRYTVCCCMCYSILPCASHAQTNEHQSIEQGEVDRNVELSRLPREKTAHELFDIAAGHYSSDAWKLAIEGFESLRATYPKSPEARASLFYIGEAYTQLKQYAAAIDAFQQYAREDADGEHCIRSQFRIGECLYMLKRDYEALRVLQDFVFEHPDDPLLEIALPIVGRLRLLRQEPQLAQRAFETFLQQFPDSTSASECTFRLAQSLQQQAKILEAAQYFRSLAIQADFNRTDQALLELGRISFTEGHWNEAKGWLDRLIQHFPESDCVTEAKLLLAKIYLAEDNPRAAEHLLFAFREPKIDEPVSNAIMIEQARIQLALGHVAVATELLERVAWNSNQDFWVDLATELRIAIASERQEWQLIRQLAENYRQRNLRGANYYTITLAEGVAAFQLNDIVHALNVFQLLFGQIEPDDFHRFERISYWIALCELQQNQLDSALTRLEQIDHFAGDTKFEASVAFVKATAFGASNNDGAAIPELTKYLNLVPNGADAVKAKRQLVLALARHTQIPESDRILSELWESIAAPTQIELALHVAFLAAQNQHESIASKWYQAVLDISEPGELREQALNGLAFVGSRTSEETNLMPAVARLQREIESGETSAIKASLALAATLQQNGNWQHAKRLHSAIISRWQTDPTSVDIAQAVASAQTLAQHVDFQNEFEFEQACERLKSLASEHVEIENRGAIWYQIAWLRLKAGQSKLAVESFRTIVDNFPESPYRSDAMFRLARIALDQGDSKTAKRWLIQLVETGTAGESMAYGLYQLGKFAVRETSWEEVNLLMQRLVAEYPELGVASHAAYWLAESHFQLSQFDRAEAWFEKIMSSDNQPENRRIRSLLRLAQIKAGENRWLEVEQLVRSYKRSFPDNDFEYQFDYMMGRCKMDRGQFSVARNYFVAVIDSPHAADSEIAAMAQWMIGETYFHQEKYLKAIGEYFLVESNYSFPEWQATALVQAAKCYERLSEQTSANKLYRHIATEYSETEPGARARLHLESIEAIIPTSDSRPSR